MVKAQEFWSFLCDGLDYRFFAGVPCPGLDPLYKKMDSKFMHYIPAANERIALGLVTGANLAGFKSGILMDMKYSYDLTSLLNFNINNRIPFLVIGYVESEEWENLAYDFPKIKLSKDYKTELSKVARKSESESVPGLIIVCKGVLS